MSAPGTPNTLRRKASPKQVIQQIVDGEAEEEVNLTNNTIFQMKHATIIPEMMKALESDTRVKKLHLKSCDISSQDCVHIAAMLEKNATLQELDLEKNKITNEGVKALSAALRNNSTLLTLNLLGQPHAFGEPCLAAVIKMFEHNVTLTKITWRLDSRKSFAINKLIVRNNQIADWLSKGKDVTHLIPKHCNVADLAALRPAVEEAEAVEEREAPEEEQEQEQEAEAVEEEPPKEEEKKAPSTPISSSTKNLLAAFEKKAVDASPTGSPSPVRRSPGLNSPAMRRMSRNSSSPGTLRLSAGSPKYAIEGIKENDPETTEVDLSNNTIFQMKHTEYTTKLVEAMRDNTHVTSIILKQCELTSADCALLAGMLETNTTVTNLDLEKNKITNEGVIALCEGLKNNSTLLTLNLLGQPHAFGEPCLAAVIELFNHNVTLTKITWRLDSRKSFAINKLIVRNNQITEWLSKGKDVTHLIPNSCNVPELAALRAAEPVAKEEPAEEEPAEEEAAEEEAAEEEPAEEEPAEEEPAEEEPAEEEPAEEEAAEEEVVEDDAAEEEVVEDEEELAEEEGEQEEAGEEEEKVVNEDE